MSEDKIILCSSEKTRQILHKAKNNIKLIKSTDRRNRLFELTTILFDLTTIVSKVKMMKQLVVVSLVSVCLTKYVAHRPDGSQRSHETMERVR